MSVLSFAFILVARFCSCAGQIFFKKAMHRNDGGDGIRFPYLASGIVAMALNFFLWLGLMKKFDLSHLYPFVGLDHVLIVLSSWFFLRERISAGLWIGMILISAGVALVSTN